MQKGRCQRGSWGAWTRAGMREDSRCWAGGITGSGKAWEAWGGFAKDEPRASGPAQCQQVSLGLMLAQGDTLQVRPSGPGGLLRRRHWDGK